jgi:hypothetical protein
MLQLRYSLQYMQVNPNLIKFSRPDVKQIEVTIKPSHIDRKIVFYKFQRIIFFIQSV